MAKKTYAIHATIPPEYPTLHAAYALVQSSEEEFFLTFFDVKLPFTSPTTQPGEIQPETEVVPAYPVARIALAPSRMQALADAIAENLRLRNEGKTATISIPQKKQ